MAEREQVQTKGMSVSLRLKLLFGFTLVFSLVFAVAFYWFYHFSTQMALSRIEEDLRDTLRGAIDGISGDEFEALAKEGVPDETGVPSADPRYIAHQKWLMTVHQIEPRAFNTYTFIKGEGEREVLWIGDNYRVIRKDVATVFKEPYEVGLDSVLLNGLKEDTVNMNYYTDDWGTWVSAYGPILNSDLEVVGGLGMDMKADYVRQVQQAIQDRVVVSFLITYAALFFLVYLLSRGLTRPITALTAVAERVAEGEYDQDISKLYSGRMRDEVSTLAYVFDMMVDKVHAREEHLKRQVRELRIEIDQTKKERHVQEIVESDYFKDLQATAREMRRRSRGQDDSSET
ncbi:MAG: HAMP domain-containing protein [Anaerolineae bacterium]|nr:HAMP domain-containing protein [Anaerolineae bacterium]